MSESVITLDYVTTLVLQLSPLDKVRLIERVMPALEQDLITLEKPGDTLSAWQQVYVGLSDQDIGEVESIALDRSNFSRQRI